MVKLFFFGCWGYLGKGSGLKKVFASLNNTVSKGDHVVILGDNYYPSEKIESEGGKKNYFTSFKEISKIFEYLNILRTKKCHIHLLMGNHEYKDDTLTLKDYYDKKSQGGGLKLIQTGDPSKFKTFALEYGYIKTLGLYSDIGMCPIEGLPHTLLLKLDTNMFTIDKHKNEVELPYEYNGNFTAGSLLGNQDFSDIQRVFICGHIPIGSKIYKKGKHKLDQSLPIELYDLMFELVQNIKSKNEGIKIYYMCADTHYFQRVEIEMKREGESYELEQFVAGTGGNKLDPWAEDTTNQTTYSDSKGGTSIRFNYEIIETQHKHGYVMVDDTGEPEFVSVSSHEGGRYKEVKSGHKSKRKTKKRKTKKLKRKPKRKTNKRKTKRKSKKHK